MSSGASAPMLMYPDKFHMALRYAEAVMMSGESADLSDSDKLLLDALSKQALLRPPAVNNAHTCFLLYLLLCTRACVHFKSAPLWPSWLCEA